jgi:TrmH family RNA methyltransferase
MISIVLIGPEKSGNIGAIARVMKNFGVKQLILIEPKCEHLNKESLDRASHAADILKKAKILKKSQLSSFSLLVGTTAKYGTDYNIPRIPLTPAELSARLKELSQKAKIGLVFGRESHGLSNEELLMCDLSVTIPTTPSYPTMNLSHSVAVVLYELFKEQLGSNIKSKFTPISQKEKEVIMAKIEKIMGKMQFSTQSRKQTQREMWRRLLGKSMLTRREAFTLIGFLRKLE